MTAVIFDGFGTLVQITQKTYPYRDILKEGVRQGRKLEIDDRYRLLSEDYTLKEAAEALGIALDASRLREIRAKLEVELQSIHAFEDGLDAVQSLQAEGIQVAICSNLATPYGAPIRNLFPELDAYGFSYELGFVKPDPGIFLQTCKAMGAGNADYFGKGRVLVIGDSAWCDRDGARAVGLNGLLLSRSGHGNFSNLISFAHAVIESEQRFR